EILRAFEAKLGKQHAEVLAMIELELGIDVAVGRRELQLPFGLVQMQVRVLQRQPPARAGQPEGQPRAKTGSILNSTCARVPEVYLTDIWRDVDSRDDSPHESKRRLSARCRLGGNALPVDQRRLVLSQGNLSRLGGSASYRDRLDLPFKDKNL